MKFSLRVTPAARLGIAVFLLVLGFMFHGDAEKSKAFMGYDRLMWLFALAIVLSVIGEYVISRVRNK